MYPWEIECKHIHSDLSGLLADLIRQKHQSGSISTEGLLQTK